MYLIRILKHVDLRQLLAETLRKFALGNCHRSSCLWSSDASFLPRLKRLTICTPYAESIYFDQIRLDFASILAKFDTSGWHLSDKHDSFRIRTTATEYVGLSTRRTIDTQLINKSVSLIRSMLRQTNVALQQNRQYQ